MFIDISQNYERPRYRITIVPKYLSWGVHYVWVLKHWGKKRVEAACFGGYRHKFCDKNDILYYRID